MTETPIDPGFRIGNYILKEEIGRGVFSHVWKAVHHERPNRVAAACHPPQPLNHRMVRLANNG